MTLIAQKPSLGTAARREAVIKKDDGAGDAGINNQEIARVVPTRPSR